MYMYVPKVIVRMYYYLISDAIVSLECFYQHLILISPNSKYMLFLSIYVCLYLPLHCNMSKCVRTCIYIYAQCAKLLVDIGQ